MRLSFILDLGFIFNCVIKYLIDEFLYFTNLFEMIMRFSI
jgi:hypothetical protein